MPWARTRERRKQELEALLIRVVSLQMEALLPMVEQVVQQVADRESRHLQTSHLRQLTDLGREIAPALERQDKLLQRETEVLSLTAGNHHYQTIEMLKEVLNSLQPTPEQRLLNGRSKPLPSSLASAISAKP